MEIYIDGDDVAEEVTETLIFSRAVAEEFDEHKDAWLTHVVESAEFNYAVRQLVSEGLLNALSDHRLDGIDEKTFSAIKQVVEDKLPSMIEGAMEERFTHVLYDEVTFFVKEEMRAGLRRLLSVFTTALEDAGLQ